MEGKYHILGITTEGKRNYWTGSGWSEVLTDSKIFTDLDDARDEWWEVTGNGKKLPEGFKRIVVPNYPEPEPKLVQMPGTQGNWGEKHWGAKEGLDTYEATYQFPKLSPEDRDVLKEYNLEIVFDKDPTNTTVGGKYEDIKRFAEGWLGYQLVEDYLERNESATEIAVKNPDVSKLFDIKSLIKEFQQYLRNQNRYDDVWYSGKPDSFTVDVNGDWKHDHLYMDMLVEEFLNDKGLTLADVQSRTIEEDGSDWYRAERTYRIKVPKTGELTAGQIAKKINNKFEDAMTSGTDGNYNVEKVQIYNPEYKKAEESIKGQASSNFSRKSVYESIIGRR